MKTTILLSLSRFLEVETDYLGTEKSQLEKSHELHQHTLYIISMLFKIFQLSTCVLNVLSYWSQFYPIYNLLKDRNDTHYSNFFRLFRCPVNEKPVKHVND